MDEINKKWNKHSQQYQKRKQSLTVQSRYMLHRRAARITCLHIVIIEKSLARDSNPAKRMWYFKTFFCGQRELLRTVAPSCAVPLSPLPLYLHPLLFVLSQLPRADQTARSCFSGRQPRISNLGVLGAERADSLAGAPDLEVADLLHLLLEGLAVVGAASVVEGALGLGTVTGGLVELLEEGLEVGLEALGPVNGTAAGGGGAGLVHVVHAVGTDQRVEGLGGLLDGLVEGLAGSVAVLTENLVLGEEHTVDTTHEAATLAVKVRVDLLLEGGLVEVAGTDGNTHGDGLLEGLAGHVLVDGDGAVDTAALLEERADSAARALGGDEDNVNVRGDLDVGAVLEDGGETVGEVEGL